MHTVMVSGQHKALLIALNRFAESEGVGPLARVPDQIVGGRLEAAWTFAHHNHTLQEHIYSFVTEDRACAERFVAAAGDLVLGRYEGDERCGAIFYDDGVEGELAWRQAEREGIAPQLILRGFEGTGDPEPETALQREALRWLREQARQTMDNRVATIVSCPDRDAFRILCGFGEDDPCIRAIVSGLADPRTALHRLGPVQGSQLHELRRLGHRCGWAFGYSHGGGEGEYCCLSWFREPLLARDAWETLETLATTRRSVRPIARF